ncbi:uncharacterized protein [Aegilops tauschii subsp. strangulata]|uniref:uncharacterized protein n=1 Tax=Aegilops tauschii subsp. strangulata TaxID=200361 RepID=UPI003CC856A2
MDSSATAHMTAHPGNLTFATPVHTPTRITVVTNLVSVRRLARENPVTVEFDAIGFSVKDAPTWMFGLPILALQTDSGKEFDNVAIRNHLASHITIFRLSCPYTSEQNGRAERVIRTLNDCVRALLFHSYVPPRFWPDALVTASLLINIRPCRPCWNYTPHQLLFGTVTLGVSRGAVRPCLHLWQTAQPRTGLGPAALPAPAAPVAAAPSAAPVAVASGAATGGPSESSETGSTSSSPVPPRLRQLQPHLSPAWSLGLELGHSPDGSLESYKARWVVRGFCQRAGVDFTDTFAPVVKPGTIRAVLQLAVSRAWPVHQLNGSNAFLHGHLDEQVFCQQPTGFVDTDYPDHVCLLSRSLYGLKQAPRAWYQRIAAFLQQQGFRSTRSDASLFVYHQGTATAYLLLYVDDVILTASSPALLQQITARLSTEIALKDLGDLHYFLGIEVVRRATSFFLHQ